MTTRRAKIFGASAAVIALLAVSLWWFPRSSFFAWDAPPPGTLVAERVAPDSGLVARVRAGATKGQYVLELETTTGGELVASDTITAPVGYHEHRITLRWVTDSARAIATIDHDFGEGNLEFSLASVRPKPPNKRLKLAVRVD
jgi:hypothetical protein